jgi:hypothetical protein
VNVGTSLALYEVDSEGGSADGYIFPSFSQQVRAAVHTSPISRSSLHAPSVCQRYLTVRRRCDTRTACG